jgi:hypothetical protein
MVISKLLVLPVIAVVCIVVLFIYGPLPQDPDYHQFADRRTIFGVRNFINVLSNVPFLLVGLKVFRGCKDMMETSARYICKSLFAGFILLTIGSGYYHFNPTNATLVYDRLCMVIIFMSFFAFTIHESINAASGFISFFVLNVVGVLSVVYWIATENTGRGDLRSYAMVQFFPVVAIPIVLILYKPAFPTVKEIMAVFAFFAIAKLAEQWDQQIFEVSAYTLSGHSLKHFLMAASGYQIVLLVKRRNMV